MFYAEIFSYAFLCFPTFYAEILLLWCSLKDHVVPAVVVAGFVLAIVVACCTLRWRRQDRRREDLEAARAAEASRPAAELARAPGSYVHQGTDALEARALHVPTGVYVPRVIVIV